MKTISKLIIFAVTLILVALTSIQNISAECPAGYSQVGYEDETCNCVYGGSSCCVAMALSTQIK
jgi:hypothetical protein